MVFHGYSRFRVVCPDNRLIHPPNVGVRHVREVPLHHVVLAVEPGNILRAFPALGDPFSKHRGYAYDGMSADFDHYMNLEQSARRMTTWQLALLPGLLQTPDYRRANAWAEGPTRDHDAIEGLVRLATNRQARLSDPNFEFEVLLSEAILHHQVGSRAVMIEQFERLLEVMQLPNVTIRIIPFAASSTLGLIVGPFVLMEFAPLPTTNLDLSPGLRPGVIGFGLGFSLMVSSVWATGSCPVSGLAAGFHGPGGCSFLFVGVVVAGQSGCRRLRAVVRRLAWGAWWGSRNQVRRAWRMIRAGSENNCRRSVFGSQRRAGWSCRVMVCSHAVRSRASATIASQIWLAA